MQMTNVMMLAILGQTIFSTARMQLERSTLTPWKRAKLHKLVLSCAFLGSSLTTLVAPTPILVCVCAHARMVAVSPFVQISFSQFSSFAQLAYIIFVLICPAAVACVFYLFLMGLIMYRASLSSVCVLGFLAIRGLVLPHIGPPSYWKLMRQQTITEEKKLSNASVMIKEFVEGNIANERWRREFVTKANLKARYLYVKFKWEKEQNDSEVSQRKITSNCPKKEIWAPMGFSSCGVTVWPKGSVLLF